MCQVLKFIYGKLHMGLRHTTSQQFRSDEPAMRLIPESTVKCLISTSTLRLKDRTFSMGELCC
jgi:hypothetical protein